MKIAVGSHCRRSPRTTPRPCGGVGHGRSRALALRTAPPTGPDRAAGTGRERPCGTPTGDGRLSWPRSRTSSGRRCPRSSDGRGCCAARQSDRETIDRALESIERNVRVQTRVLDDLLDISRILSGRLRLEVRPTELTPLVAGAIEAIRAEARAKAIRLDTALDPRAGAVAGDPERLQQILWTPRLECRAGSTPAGGSVEIRLERRGRRHRGPRDRQRAGNPRRSSSLTSSRCAGRRTPGRRALQGVSGSAWRSRVISRISTAGRSGWRAPGSGAARRSR